MQYLELIIILIDRFRVRVRVKYKFKDYQIATLGNVQMTEGLTSMDDLRVLRLKILD
jgi:hypothetical protein